MTPCPHLVGRVMTVMEAAFEPAYGEAWNRRQVTDALTLPSTHALVLDAEAQPLEGVPLLPNSPEPAAFVLTRFAADEEELLLIAVTPNHRRRGLGRELIEQLFAASKARGAKRLFLEMRQGNPAINLYEMVGFKPIGRRPNYYRLSNGEKVDAITFGCSL